MNDKEHKPNDHDASGYEHRDVNVTRIAVIGLISVVALTISILLVHQIYIIYREKLVEEVVLRPESAALRELRAREDEVLNSYRILDAEKGLYRIPISRAMQLVADEAYRGRIESGREQ